MVNKSLEIKGRAFTFIPSSRFKRTYECGGDEEVGSGISVVGFARSAIPFSIIIFQWLGGKDILSQSLISELSVVSWVNQKINTVDCWR